MYQALTLTPSLVRVSWLCCVQYLSPELVLKKGYNREVDMWCIGILAYILTTATFPFDGRTQQDLLQNIVNARFNTSVPAWQEMEPAARDFIKRLLQVDPQKRLTSKEALEHPWITGAPFTAAPGSSSLASSFASPMLAPATPAALSTHASPDGGGLDALPPLPPAMMTPVARTTPSRGVESPDT